MRDRPFTLLLLSLITLPLVLNELPPPDVLVEQLDAATDGSWQWLAALLGVSGSVFLFRQWKRDGFDH